MDAEPYSDYRVKWFVGAGAGRPDPTRHLEPFAQGAVCFRDGSVAFKASSLAWVFAYTDKLPP